MSGKNSKLLKSFGTRGAGGQEAGSDGPGHSWLRRGRRWAPRGRSTSASVTTICATSRLAGRGAATVSLGASGNGSPTGRCPAAMISKSHRSAGIGSAHSPRTRLAWARDTKRKKYVFSLTPALTVVLSEKNPCWSPEFLFDIGSIYWSIFFLMTVK